MQVNQLLGWGRWGIAMLWFVGMSSLFYPTQNSITAQDHERQPIFEGGFDINNVTWSPDSQFVSFHLGGSDIYVETEWESWYGYELDTGILSEGHVWPLQPQLSKAELENFNPLDGSYIFLSPNERFIVYATQDDTLDYYESGLHFGLALGDLETGERKNLSLYVETPLNGPEYLNVTWSADSSAFVVFDQQLTPIITYVSNYGRFIGDAEAISFSTTTGVGSWNVYDVSDDGRKVLVSAMTWENYQSDYRLMVWDVTDSSQSIVIDEVDASEIAAAILAPDTLDRILFVNPEGLSEYDSQSHQTTLLDPMLSGGYFEVGRIMFSPDGRWLAYYGFEDGFFVIPMSDYLQE